MTTNNALEALNDQTLISRFGVLVRQDHEGNANLLRHIDAIDRRQLWAKLGYPSMFAFLVSRYHMSESTAGKRIGAARTARRFRSLFTMVARGEIHLSGIHRLKAHLTSENHEQVLAAAKHRTIRQIEELVARLAPQPDVPSTLRALPTCTPAAPAPAPTSLAPTPAAAFPAPTPAAASPAPTPASAPPTPSSAPPAPSTSRPMPVPRRSPDPAPLSPGRYKLQVTLGENAHSKLKQLQDLLAHQIPNGDPAAIVERALDALWTQVHKSKTGIASKPQAQKAKPESKANATATPTARRTRYIKSAVRREVWIRDEGRCGFVGEDGHRCDETRGLQFGHRDPWGKGGADTAVNLGLRCIAHNAWEADRDYGTSHMASKRKRKPWKVQEPVARYSVRRRLVEGWPSFRTPEAYKRTCGCACSPGTQLAHKVKKMGHSTSRSNPVPPPTVRRGIRQARPYREPSRRYGASSLDRPRWQPREAPRPWTRPAKDVSNDQAGMPKLAQRDVPATCSAAGAYDWISNRCSAKLGLPRFC